MIRLFDIEKGVLKPTPNCYAISWLKVIMDKYPKDYMKIYSYLYYMTCPTEDNPYINVIESEKEDIIIREVGIKTSLDSKEIVYARKRLENLFETPSARSYKACKIMLDKLSAYMEEAEVQGGKDGNLSDIIRLLKEFDSARMTYKNAYKDLQQEQQNIAKGGIQMSYDQMGGHNNDDIL